jgi:hypothetical protein
VGSIYKVISQTFSYPCLTTLGDTFSDTKSHQHPVKKKKNPFGREKTQSPALSYQDGSVRCTGPAFCGKEMRWAFWPGVTCAGGLSWPEVTLWARPWWLTAVILGTQEAEIRRIEA